MVLGHRLWRASKLDPGQTKFPRTGVKIPRTQPFQEVL